MNILTPEDKNICAESLFAQLFERGGDGVLIVQRDGAIAYANKPIQDLLGLSADELLAGPFARLFPDAKKKKYANRFDAFFLDKKGFDRYDAEFVKKDGLVVAVELSVFDTVFKKGPAQIIVVRDVQEHKQADIEAYKHFDHYKDLASIVDQSFEPIIITDMEGVIQYANASWERLNGWAAGEVVGKVTPRIMKSGVQPADFYEEFWKELSEGLVVERTVTNKRKDGTFYEADIVATPLKNDQGAITGFAGFQHDITAKRQIQEQLLQEKKFSEDIIERANAIVVVIDPQGVVTRFNTKAENIFGYSKEDILGKNLFETVFPREKYPLLWSEFSYTNVEKGMTKNFENSFMTKDGEERFLEWSVSEINRDGKTIAIISFGLDITARKKAEDHILETNKDLERFKDLMVGRELKMIELKKEIDALKHSVAKHAEPDLN